MRFYIVDCNGEVYGEGDSREWAEMEMNLMFSEEEIKEKEIEVIGDCED